MDLLTVVMHELGHVLGHNHKTDGVMAETLAAGVRQTDTEQVPVAVVDQVFAQTVDHRPDSWAGIWLSEQQDSTRLGGKRYR